MADLDKRPDVIKRLTAEGFFFNFFQAMSLIEEKSKRSTPSKSLSKPAKSAVYPIFLLLFRQATLKKSGTKTAP